MAQSSAKSAPLRPATRLYLATPVVEDPSDVIARLPELISTADVAAVLVRLAPADPRTLTTRAKALAPVIQPRGVAMLLEGHADIVARAGADGAHLTGVDAMREMLPALRPDRIAGVGGLVTRHDAMTAGEAGADYVLFGEPDAQNLRPSADAVAERLDWWAELFEPPCVAYADSHDDAARFAAAGADFVLVGEHIWTDARGAEAALEEIARAIASSRRAPTTAEA